MRKLRAGFAIAAASSAVLLALHAVGLVERLELIALDARYASGLGRKAPREDIVVAWIDQESMDFMEENDLSFPWPRSTYEGVLSYVVEGGARAVGFDVLFDQPGQVAEDDALFGEALARTPSTAVVSKLVSSRRGGRNAEQTERQHERARALGPLAARDAGVASGFVLPIDEIEHNVAHVGFANVLPDSDKVYRRYEVGRTLVDAAGEPVGAVPSFAAATLLAGGGDPALVTDRDQTRILLNFRGPEYTYEHVKFVNLLLSVNQAAEGEEPLYPKERFAGKHVLVGIHAEGYEDIHPTPLSRQFPGVELHATALDNLLSGDMLRELGFGRVAGVAAAALAVALVFLLPGVAAPSVALALALLALLAAASGTFAAGLVVPVAAPVLGLALGGGGGFVWRVAVEGRQKREMRRAFSSYMAPEVLAEVLAHPEHVALGGEAREVTLFFSDLAGFTGLAEHVGPEELVRFLNDYFTRMCEPLLAEQGVIDKFIGDAIMALFGAPLRGTDHAGNAVRAALAASAVSVAIAEELRAAGKPAIETRIGLHSGLAIVGNMGSAKRFDYTAIGDTVNLASRLEGANKAFGTRILVSETTWKAAGGTAVGREVGLVGVKGREEPIRVYEPLAPAGAVPSETRSALERHAAALALLRSGDRAEARRAFAALAADRPGDHLAALYVERLGDPGWDGVWRLDAK